MYVTILAGEPEITYEDKYDETMVFKAGGTIMIPVTVTGFPTPTTKWFQDEQELSVTDKVSIETVDNRNTLTIKAVSASNAGTYKITAENKVGSDSAEFVIKIRGKLGHEITSQRTTSIFSRI